jgi:pre-60S factor REI1
MNSKKFHSDAQLTQHLETKKHKLQEAKGPVSKPARGSETSSLASSVDSSAAPSVPALTEEQLMSMTDEEIYDYRLKTCRKFDLTDCLFCKHSSPTLKANLRHMSIDHSFYIPDIEYLVDLEGLIKYLGEKISVGWVCLNCNGSGKTFHSCEAVQDHMRSLGHCKLAYDDEEQEEEFADFYDFTEYYKAKGIDPEKGPEDLTTNEFGELILSDSTVIGHRELKHIYKQQAAGIRRHESALIQSLVSEYRALALKKDQVAKLPPSKDARRNRDMALRVGTQANRLVRLRFRSDCPI